MPRIRFLEIELRGIIFKHNIFIFLPMFKSAYLISDYLSFNCRNSCLGFDYIFMYVN